MNVYQAYVCVMYIALLCYLYKLMYTILPDYSNDNYYVWLIII